MDLKPESRDGFLLATVTGTISLEKAIDTFEKTCDAAMQRGFHKIVVDLLAVSGELSDLDLYELGKTVADYYLQHLRFPIVAVIGRPPLVNGFGAKVASNRGLTTEVFLDLQSAIDWLNRFGTTAAATS